MLQNELKLKIDQINAESCSDTDVSLFENTEYGNENEILNRTSEHEEIYTA